MGLKDFFTPVKSMDADEAKAFIADRPEDSFTILDVRQPGEYEQEHIPGAKLIPLPKLSDSLDELDQQKPTIVHCAIGGRSLVAAKLLSGRGFKEVYNLKGGIKAWQGFKATGPQEFHLAFLKEAETADAMVRTAYHMEDALGFFYQTLQKSTTDLELSTLFVDLASYEKQHKQRIIEICQQMGLTINEKLLQSKSVGKDFIEGGLNKEEFLSQNEPYLKKPTDVLNIAMMIETQALDLYLRLSNEVSDENAKALLFKIAAEEKKHLGSLAQLLEEKI